MTNPILTIVRGLPGSGKSTYARKLAAETGCTPNKPLFGNRMPKAAGTHWIVFMKTEEQP